MKKVFFFDIDDTLLPKGKNLGVSENNKLAIKKLKENGHDVYIASGKSIGMCKKIYETIDTYSSVTSNGSVVNLNNEVVYQRPITKDDIKVLADHIATLEGSFLGGQGNEHAYVICNDDQFYQDHIVRIYKSLDVEIPIKCEEFPEDIFQLWLLGNINVDLSFLGDKYDSFVWDEMGLDIVYKGTSKALGINYLLDNVYKDQEIETYAFGDGLNDIAMFELVDHSVAVSNAHEKLKTVAEDITDNGENDGIYKYLTTKGII